MNGAKILRFYRVDLGDSILAMSDTRTYAIIGGSSGMGFGLAQRLIDRGDRVLIGGRSEDRLRQACARLGGGATGRSVDIQSRASLASFFKDCGRLAGLFAPGSSYSTGPFRETDETTAESAFRAKFWGQYWAIHAALPHLGEQSAVVLMSGAASARPLGNAAYAACNAAIEGLTRALAGELAPIRVNCLSPGTIDSELWRDRPASIREPVFDQWRSLSLTGRVGHVDDAVHAALFLLDNRNMTGSTIYNDGGYTLR